MTIQERKRGPKPYKKSATPENILSKLTMALTETHELRLRETEENLRNLIIDFCHEVKEKNLDEGDFEAIAVFIIKVLQNNEKTIHEFLQILEDHEMME